MSSKLPELMAIVNVTPDSFSGDGIGHIDLVLEKIAHVIEAGAAIIDIGAESTRPGAEILSAEEEWQRLQPILGPAIALAHEMGARVSLDSYHPESCKQALLLGIDWINDVTGLDQKEMRAVAADSDANIVVMHHLGVPVDKNVTLPEEVDVITTLQEWQAQKIWVCENSSIAKERLIFDPGIGFGKTRQQNFTLCRDAHLLTEDGTKWLYGYSRKSLFNALTSAAFADRDIETLALSCFLAEKNIAYLRVHNVEIHQRAWNVQHAMR